MGSTKEFTEVDVVIIGAGISGINFAYRLQERCPNVSYTIIEGRHEIGGTWSLFKYPGESRSHRPTRPSDLALTTPQASAPTRICTLSASHGGRGPRGAPSPRAAASSTT